MFQVNRSSCLILSIPSLNFQELLLTKANCKGREGMTSFYCSTRPRPWWISWKKIPHSPLDLFCIYFLTLNTLLIAGLQLKS